MMNLNLSATGACVSPGDGYKFVGRALALFEVSTGGRFAMKRRRILPFGAELIEGGGTRFRLWAPSAKRVTLVGGTAANRHVKADMERAQDGWLDLTVREMGAGATYHYRIDDEIDVPDPASRFNPRGVDHDSVVVDPRAFE